MGSCCHHHHCTRRRFCSFFHAWAAWQNQVWIYWQLGAEALWPLLSWLSVPKLFHLGGTLSVTANDRAELGAFLFHATRVPHQTSAATAASSGKWDGGCSRAETTYWFRKYKPGKNGGGQKKNRKKICNNFYFKDLSCFHAHIMYRIYIYIHI